MGIITKMFLSLSIVSVTNLLAESIQAPIDLHYYTKKTIDNRVKIKFKDNSTNEAGFRIYQDGVAVEKVTSTSKGSIGKTYGKYIKNLKACTEYSFIVKAIARDSISEASNIILIKTTGCGNNNNGNVGINPPLRLESYSDKTIDNRVKIKFKDNSINEAGFRIYQDGVAVEKVTSTSKGSIGKTYGKYIKNLKACTEYSFVVKAIARDSISEASNIISIKTTGCGNNNDGKSLIKNIILSQTDISLKEDESTKLTLQVIYKDGAVEDITRDINWIVGDNTFISIDKEGHLNALKAGATLIQATYHGKVSEEVKVTITKKEEVINGYTLPPEPDPKVNNATLLGVDSNGNGVRDDVERYIIKRFAQDPEFPKTKTAIALQYAWAKQKIIENPTRDSMRYEDDATDCAFYWYRQETKDLSGHEYILWTNNQEVYDDNIREKIFNTKERVKQYVKYNSVLSGGIYQGRLLSIDSCQTNIDVIGE